MYKNKNGLLIEVAKINKIVKKTDRETNTNMHHSVSYHGAGSNSYGRPFISYSMDPKAHPTYIYTYIHKNIYTYKHICVNPRVRPPSHHHKSFH
jgi:hypothetical protein